MLNSGEDQRLLDFAIVGAAKSGTSSLSNLMTAHGGIHVLTPKDGHHFFTAVGNPSFSGPQDEIFNSKIRASGEQYCRQLAEVDEEVRVGDASVFYMTNRSVLENLAQHLTPHAPVIAVLRRPDARAYSAYMHMFREGLEDGTFAEGLAKEEERIDAGWQPIWWYRKLGHYSLQIEDLIDVFGRERVHVLLYEDLTTDPKQALSNVYEALSVDWQDVSLHRNNASGAPRSRVLQKFLSDKNFIKTAGSRIVPRSAWLNVRARIESHNLRRVPMEPEVKAALTVYFRDEVERLETLIDRDLTAWKS